jgi:hypothetical protein
MTDETGARRHLVRLDVPPHSDGFWSELDASLRSAQGTPVVGLETRSVRPRRGRWMAIAAAAVVIAGVGGALWLGDGGSVADTATTVAPGDVASDGAQGSAASTTTAVTPSSPTTAAASVGGGPSTTTSLPTTIATPTPAPWSFRVPATAVPGVLVDEWTVAENRQWCPALYPEASAGAGAVARAAAFGGGWAVAWDVPSGPGSAATGQFCEDCGRSAFGVAGADLLVDADTGLRMPNVIRFEDGAVAGYTGEGFDPGNPKRLAELSIPGAGCVYQVWSHLGDDHLLSLLNSLRSVEGLTAGAVRLRTATDIEYIDGGPAPWSGESVAAEGLADPDALLALSEPAAVVGGAVARSVSGYSWGIAWDAPSGPGHDSFNAACETCGRGVVGVVGETDTTFAPDPETLWLAVIEWDDGSRAEVTWYMSDPALPSDAALRRAVDSADLVPDGHRAFLSVPGIDGYVEVWTHLGFDHLLRVLEALRFVGG